MGKLTNPLLWAGTMLAQGMAAQPQPPAPAPAVSAVAPSTAPVVKLDTNASRYRLEQADQFIQETLAKFAIRSRVTDPFGLAQDPSAQPQQPKIIPKSKKPLQNIAPTPFADVIAAIRVNAVMPSKGRFLVRDRTFCNGESFPLKYNDKVVQVRVTGVTDQAITFENLNSGETASLALGKLPPGMQRGAGSTGPPGLQRDNPSAPLEVSVATSTTAAAERR